jgi:hypothetical protein
MIKFPVITLWLLILQVRWQNDTFVKFVIKDVIRTWHINMNRRVVIECLSLRVHLPNFEFHASRAIELLGAGCILTSITKLSYEERNFVNRWRNALRAVVCSRIRSTNVLSHTVQIVNKTWRSDISAIWQHRKTKCLAAIMYYLFFMILKIHTIQWFPIRQHCMLHI